LLFIINKYIIIVCLGVFRWRQQWSVPTRTWSGHCTCTARKTTDTVDCTWYHRTTWASRRNAGL